MNLKDIFKRKKKASVNEKVPKKQKNPEPDKQKNLEPDIQIMMLGARRVGKTSMLASMYNAFSSVTVGTNLIMSKKGGTELDDALKSMKQIFNKKHIVNDIIELFDYKQTPGFDRIDFRLSIAGKKSVKPIVVRYIDCDGKWFNERTHEDEIGTEIEKSDVVIIAIDTVLLMEKNGKYNEQNAIQSVTEFIINNMNPDDILNDKKMVLFVPTKCEKYFNQNNNPKSIFYGKRMKTITKKIQEEYAQLLNFLMSPNNKKYFTVGILPVITIGGVELDEFTADSNYIKSGNIQYRYCEPDKFEPKFCDRPLIYSLLFVQKKISSDYYSKAYNANKNKKKLTATVIEWFKEKRNIAQVPDYIEELNKVVEKLSTVDYPGFQMLQDPESIAMKVPSYKRS